MRPFYERKENRVQIGFLDFISFPQHLHAQVEIAHAFEGEVCMCIGGHEYRLHAGDTAIAFPDRVHSYQASSGSGLMLIFPTEISADFGRVLMTRQPSFPVLRAADAHADIPAMMRVIYAEANGAREEAALRAYIQVVLARLIPALSLHSESAEVAHGVLHNAMRYLGENFDQPVTLDELSRALGTSKYHLSHLFSERLGMNFRAYVNALRADRARALLTSTNAPITQICYECGFENQRTFNRAFLAACGMTPTQYRDVPAHSRIRI